MRVGCLLVLEWLFIGTRVVVYWYWYTVLVLVYSNNPLSFEYPSHFVHFMDGGVQETRWPGKCMHSQKHVEIL